MALDPNTQNYAFLSNNLFYTYDPNTVTLVPISNVSVGNTTVNTQINATSYKIQNTSTSITITAPNTEAISNLYILCANGSWVNSGAVYISGGVNTAASYTWTNVHTFQANIVISKAEFGTTVANVVANTSTVKLSTNATNYALLQPTYFEMQDDSNWMGFGPGWFSITSISLPDNASVNPGYIFQGNTTHYSFLETTGLRLVNTGIQANGSYGSGGQLLASNGSSVYWTDGFSLNSAAAYTWTNTHSWGNSTVNAQINSTSVSIQNTTSDIVITVPNTDAVSSGRFLLNANGSWTNLDTIVSGVNTAATYTWTNTHTFSLSVNVGANVSMNTTTIFVGNATSNVVANSSGVYYLGEKLVNLSYVKGNLGTQGNVVNMGHIFRINAANLTANVTIANGENTMAAGPINIDTGVYLTIESGGRVVIV